MVSNGEVGVRCEVGRGERGESYPSRWQSLAVRVWAHGQGTVEPYPSICSTVSGLELEKEREKEKKSFTQKHQWNHNSKTPIKHT